MDEIDNVEPLQTEANAEDSASLSDQELAAMTGGAKQSLLMKAVTNGTHIKQATIEM